MWHASMQPLPVCADPRSGVLDPVDPASERPDVVILGHNGPEKAHFFTRHFSYARQRKIPTYPHLMTARHPEVMAFMRDLWVRSSCTAPCCVSVASQDPKVRPQVLHTQEEAVAAQMPRALLSAPHCLAHGDWTAHS